MKLGYLVPNFKPFWILIQQEMVEVAGRSQNILLVVEFQSCIHINTCLCTAVQMHPRNK